METTTDYISESCAHPRLRPIIQLLPWVADKKEGHTKHTCSHAVC